MYLDLCWPEARTQVRILHDLSYEIRDITSLSCQMSFQEKDINIYFDTYLPGDFRFIFDGRSIFRPLTLIPVSRAWCVVKWKHGALWMKCPGLWLVRDTRTLASDWSSLDNNLCVDCTWLAERARGWGLVKTSRQFLVIRASDIIIIIMDDPRVLLTPMELQMSPDGDPRLIDTIFNVSSLTSGIFNNSLFQYAGAIIVGIILFGELFSFCSCQTWK